MSLKTTPGPAPITIPSQHTSHSPHHSPESSSPTTPTQASYRTSVPGAPKTNKIASGPTSSWFRLTAPEFVDNNLADDTHSFKFKDTTYHFEDAAYSFEDADHGSGDADHSLEDGVYSPEDSVHSPEDGVHIPEDDAHSFKFEDAAYSSEDVVHSAENAAYSSEDEAHSPRADAYILRLEDAAQGFDDETHSVEKGEIKLDILGPSREKRKVTDLEDSPMFAPLPLMRPNRERITTLLDLLLVSIPVAPMAYTKGALENTKQVTLAEITLPEEDQLRKVVLLPRLVSQLFQRVAAKLSAIRINWDDPETKYAVAHIHPWLASSWLSRTTWSEKDAELRANVVLFRSAIAAVQAVLTGHLGHDCQLAFPYVSSCPHFRPVIPDGMVVRGGKDKKDLDVATVIEIKTQAAYSDENGISKFANILALKSDDQIGQAMKFNWPEAVPDNDSQTRIITQNWTQMVHNFTRLGEDSDTLFISPEYERDDRPLLAYFCWFAMATDLLSIDDLNLPKADTKWWDKDWRIIQCESSGIVLPSTYTYEESLTARQKTIRDKEN
ncbi:hypothetical protein B0H21DRAFT_826878 [Amylocystis lapponica]|nr:hypothetical protein B0H21DRAFT_826878 [Amylocystis lapponica]